MDKLKLILAGLLTTVYKKSDEEVATLLENVDGEDFDANAVLAEIVTADKARISTVRTDGFDQGHQKGKKESLSDLEKQVRETFGIKDDSVKGLDLINAVHALDREAGKGGVTEDDVKKHSSYIELQKKLNDAQKEIETKVSAAVSEAEGKFNRERTLSKAKSKALEVFEGLNPVLSTNPDVAKNQKKNFLALIEAFEFDESEDGSLIVKKEGKALDDGHGNLVDFNSLIKNQASSLYDFKQSEDRGSAGNKTPHTPGSVRVPKTEEEYSKIILNPEIPLEERTAIKEAWRAKAQA